MSLRTAVAAPFKEAGTTRLEETRFVVALSLDRDWFSPDQAKRLVDVATGRGLLARTEDGLEPAFPIEDVEVPEEFSPGEELLSEPSAFERTLDAIVAEGVEKRRAVAGINELQAELGVTVEAAAILYARRRGIDVDDLIEPARGTLTDERQR